MHARVRTDMESVADGGVLDLLEPRERRDAGSIVHGSLVAERGLRTDARKLALKCPTKEERVLDPLVVLRLLGEGSAVAQLGAHCLGDGLLREDVLEDGCELVNDAEALDRGEQSTWIIDKCAPLREVPPLSTSRTRQRRLRSHPEMVRVAQNSPSTQSAVSGERTIGLFGSMTLCMRSAALHPSQRC